MPRVSMCPATSPDPTAVSGVGAVRVMSFAFVGISIEQAINRVEGTYTGGDMSSTSMKVRTRKSPGERSAQVLDAATDLAREQGLSALTMRAVAERAGVASGLIAHYQPSMDDLVARVYSDLVASEI